ncbi:hypothetical protein [Alkanindiges illinoisensis]|uniref:Uncharacterized protein n=1 Tax=Alkanindiges illinoisensis TaxID=197183 RepID=A0A4Y7X9D7_9GAMM|nr:hypothetical protein [Alkanindiges illinoisensis]TEU24162.1 hypothetical protein E2B99_12120 [Alkanindiges illinoisensis]
MTFIVATQLEDSVVVAADNRITIENSLAKSRHADTLQKIRFWPQGIITGTGESLVLERIFKSFQQNNNPEQLPALLRDGCEARRLEIGEHAQLEKTRLLYSYTTGTGICLKTVGRFAENIVVNAIEPMTMELFVFNEDISPIYQELIQLQQNLRNPQQCRSTSDWMNTYIAPLTTIFKKFSQSDKTVSASFDLYFQTPTQQLLQHVDAT